MDTGWFTEDPEKKTESFFGGEGTSFFPPDTTPDKTLTPEENTKTALKYHAIFGGESPGVQKVSDIIKSNNRYLLNNILENNKIKRINEARRAVVGALTKGKFNRETEAFISSISSEKIDELVKTGDPEILHKEYGREWANKWALMNGKNMDAMHSAMRRDAEGVMSAVENASKFKTYYSKIDELISRAKNHTGIAGKVWDFAESMVPLKQYNDMNNALTTALPEFKDEPWFTGNKVDALMNYIARVGTDEGLRILEKVGSTLISENVWIAQDLLSLMKNNNEVDRNLTSIFDVADVSDIAATFGAVKLGKRLLRKVKGAKVSGRVNNAVSSAIERSGSTRSADEFDTELGRTLRNTSHDEFDRRLGEVLGDNAPDYSTSGLSEKKKRKLAARAKRMERAVDEAKAARKTAAREERTKRLAGRRNFEEEMASRRESDTSYNSASRRWERRLAAGTRADEVGTPTASLEAAGETTAAGLDRSTRASAKINGVLDDLNLKETPGAFESLSTTPTLYNPELWFSGLKNSAVGIFNSNAVVRKLEKLTKDFQEISVGILRDPVLLRRLSITQMHAAMEDALERARIEFPEANHAVLDANQVVDTFGLKHNKATNTDMVAIRYGRTNGTLFPSKEAAMSFGHRVFSPKNLQWSARETVGGEWYTELYKPIDETSLKVRGTELENYEKTPQSAVNKFIGWLRAAPYRVSESQTEVRNIVTHSRALIQERMRPIFKEIGKMRKAEREDLRRVLEDYRSRRYFADTLAEFINDFRNVTGVAPSLQQTQSYYAYKHMNELDYIIRDFGWYRDKVRHGIENFEFSFHHTNSNGITTEFQSGKFEGRILADLPEIVDDAKVFIADRHNGSYSTTLRRLHEGESQIRQDLKSGRKVLIHVANQNLNPLKGVNGDDELISYVITDNHRSSPIGLQNAPNVPGGHIVYRFEDYVKAGSFHKGTDGTVTYLGDVSLFNAPTAKAAKEVADLMDQARLLLKNNAPEYADFVHTKLGEYYDDTSFRKLFESTVMPDGSVKEPPLSLEAPIVAVKSGARTTDLVNVDYRGLFPNNRFVDSIDNPHNLYGSIDKKFAGQRGEESLRPVFVEEGTLKGVDFRNTTTVVDNTLLDPFRTLEEALSNSLRSRILTDYKIKSVEDFVREFGDTLNAPIEQLRNNPVQALHEGVWKYNYSDKKKLVAAKNARRAILELLGTKTEASKSVDFINEYMQSWAFDKMGIKGWKLVSDWALPTVNDPTKFLRSFAFHSKLGLFNPVQLFLQAQSSINAVALSPKNGMKGALLTPFLRAMMVSGKDPIIKASAAKAEKVLGIFGVKAADVEEMYKWGRQSGFFTIEGEVAFKNDISDPKLFKGVFGNTLDKGAMFFNEGERMVRMTSWATAWADWKALSGNSFRKIDEKAIGEILALSKKYSLNMTSESAAAWQRGIASVPTQFFSYQARIVEQFFDGKLTIGQKARLASVYAAMYGVPATVGGFIGVWPLQEDVKKYLEANNIPYDNFAMQSIVNGLFPTMLNSILGTDYQFAERYAPGGLSIFKDVYHGDESIIGLLVGAGGKITGQAADSAWSALGETIPAVGALMGMTDVNNTGGDLDVAWSYIIRAAREVSTVNQMAGLWFALNSGIWYSKNGTKMAEVTPTDATFMALTGMKTEEMSRTGILMEVMKNANDYKKSIRSQAQTMIKLGTQSNDPKTQRAYFQRARALWIGAGLNPVEIYRDIGKSFNSTGLLPEEIERRWTKFQLERQMYKVNK